MKAILVIDIKDTPYEALKERFTNELTLYLTHNGFYRISGKDVELKPIPEKYDDEAINKNIVNYHRGFMEGFNECIDEILGEQK